jgi:hypothetical protein
MPKFRLLDWAAGAALSVLTRRRRCMANVQEVIAVTNKEFLVLRASQKIGGVLDPVDAHLPRWSVRLAS